MGSKAASFSLIFACTSTSTPVYVSPSRTKETTAFRRYERRGCRRCERTGVVRALNERKTERETTKFQRLSIALFRKQRRRAHFDFGVRLKLYVIQNERRRDHRIFLLFLPPNTSVSFPSTCMCMYYALACASLTSREGNSERIERRRRLRRWRLKSARERKRKKGRSCRYRYRFVLDGRRRKGLDHSIYSRSRETRTIQR